MGDRNRHDYQNGDRNRRSSYPQYGRQHQGDRPNSGQQKRKREDDHEEPRDDASRLLASIFRLGDAKQVRCSLSLACSARGPEHRITITVSMMMSRIDDFSRLLASILRLGDAKPVRLTNSDTAGVEVALNKAFTSHYPCRARKPLPRQFRKTSTTSTDF